MLGRSPIPVNCHVLTCHVLTVPARHETAGLCAIFLSRRQFNFPEIVPARYPGLMPAMVSMVERDYHRSEPLDCIRRLRGRSSTWKPKCRVARGFLILLSISSR